jgi:hypothetical protein
MAEVTFALKKRELGEGIESARASRWHTDRQEPGSFCADRGEGRRGCGRASSVSVHIPEISNIV